ncbi:MAG TPA: POTRA domain-containing protein [Vicinamibacterales bacterium]
MGVLLALVLTVAQVQTSQPVLSPQVLSPAAAYAGRTIVRIDLSLEGQIIEDAMLRDLLETRVGSPLSMAAVRETIAHIYSLGRFQEITVVATDLDGGVGLRYELVPVHTVIRIEFSGNLGLSERTLRNAVTSTFGRSPAASQASRVAEMLQGFYFERGYLGAAIRPVLQEVHDPEGTILNFEIEAGARAHVRNVDISGDPLVTREKFLSEIGATPGRPYERVEVDRRLSELVDELRRRGRFEARGNHRIVSQSDDGLSVDLAVTIDPGPEVVVRYEGDPLPKDRIDELVPIRTEGSINIDILEDSERRIVSFLNQQGHWKATATAARRDLNGRVEVVVTVNKGPIYRIDGGPQVSGNASVPQEEIRPLLEDLRGGEPFIAANLDRASAAIRGIYLRRGFGQVKVDSAANELPAAPNGEGRIKPVIIITEGPLIRIGEITFAGNKAVSTGELAATVSLEPGAAYYEPAVIDARERVLSEYLNRGFASASVKIVPNLTDGSRLDLRFDINEGAQSIVDHILVLGNVKTDARIIEREIQLKTGEPLGLNALFETRRRLAELGLFRRIEIDQVQHGESARYDILVRVEEAPSTTIGYGAGVERSTIFVTGADGFAESRVDLAPRGFFEVGRRNIAGKNRSASLYTRLGLRSDIDPETGTGPRFGFPEYRVVATFREPRTFGWNADSTITGVIEQGRRATFKFRRRGVNAEIVRRLTPGIRTGLRYTFATTRTFDEALTEEELAVIDRAFPEVRLSAFTATVTRDTRDDALDPTRGVFMSAEGSLAARALGGEVGFVKSYMQVQGYRPLPLGDRVVLAGRVAVGLADGFPREVTFPVPATIEDLPASERFYAGGDTTIRGFELDRVGMPNTITDSGFPRGGNGLLLLSGELRVPVWKNLGAAFFMDAGNVYERVTQIDPGELRGAVGLGLRYNLPVGPVRLDLGFKLDRRSIAGSLERRHEWHFSFGHAF